MTITRLIEIEMLAAANPNTRSAPLLIELVAEVRRLQARSAKRSGFTPPSVEDVEALFAAGKVFRNGSAAVQARAFVDHYISNGWRVGRVPMTDWQAAARGWERRAAEKIAPVMARSSEPRM